MSNAKIIKTINRIRNGSCKILITTDFLNRKCFSNINFIINYDLPISVNNY